MNDRPADSQIRLAAVEPWDQGPPAIHGPSIHGASANKQVLYAIPATGERPLVFAVEGLPEGVRLDPVTGFITGAIRREGDFRVMLRAENRHGKAEKEFVIAIGRGLALTPPMGWNSWNAWRRWVDDVKVRSAADGLVRTGLAALGYTYVNIDSCWQGARGGPHNAIQPNRKFPDMRLLSDYVHARGLKLGIYSTPWAVPWGCEKKEDVEDWGGPELIGFSSGDPEPDGPRDYFFYLGKYVGIEKHEMQDVAQWVEWGVDFLKYDWTQTDAKCLERMGRVVKAAARDIVLSICTGARLKYIDAYKAWAQMWRGTGDTDDSWANILGNGFLADDCQQEDWRPYIGPSGWHDLDMLAIGPQSDTRTGTRPNRLTPDEQITHMTVWALYPSPLILSCDLEALNDFELRLLGNEEVIAVNQDRLGKPAVRLREERSQSLVPGRPHHNGRVWGRPLADGSFAVGFFNLAERPDELSLDLHDLGLHGSASARNLWERRNLGRIWKRLSIMVPAHGAQLIRVTP
jgi:alpha-galactosidase